MEEKGDKVRKIDRYKDRIQTLTLVVTMVVALYIGITQNFINQQLLGLNTTIQKSDVVLSSSDIQITPNSYISGETEEGEGDTIVPTLSNIGNSAAKNIDLTFYLMGYKPDLSPLKLQLDTQLVQDLQPGEKAVTVLDQIPYKNEGNNLAPLIGSEQIALIFHLHYIDSLTQKSQDRVFMYQYTLGSTSSVGTLVQADYKTIYQNLMEGINNSSDTYLQEYLQDNPPI